MALVPRPSGPLAASLLASFFPHFSVSLDYYIEDFSGCIRITQMRFVEECLESYFSRLYDAEHYGAIYWKYLNNKAHMPEPKRLQAHL